MNDLDVLMGAAVALLLAFQTWLTFHVWKIDSYDREQKVAQSKLIWFLPIAGPIVVFLVSRHVRGEQPNRRS